MAQPKKKDFQFHSKLSLEGKLRTVKLLKSWYFEGLRVLRISVTGMMEAFFLSLKFPIPRYFWEGKFGKYFLGWLDFSGHIFGHSKQPEDSWQRLRIPAA